MRNTHIQRVKCNLMKKTNSSKRKTVKATKRRIWRRSMLLAVSVQVFSSLCIHSHLLFLRSCSPSIQPHESPFDATVKATNRSEVILIAFEAVHWNTDHELTIPRIFEKNYHFLIIFVPFFQHISFWENLIYFFIVFKSIYFLCFFLLILFELNGFI